MVTLYVVSSDDGAGKTMLCAGIGKYFLNDGRNVGYFKPVISQESAPQRAEDDASFLKRILALEEPPESICPVIADKVNFAGEVKEAMARISAGKDVIIIEGDGFRENNADVVQELGARLIFVEAFSKRVSPADLFDKVMNFGKHLLGIVVNKVPAKELPELKSELGSRAGESGIRVLGVFPEDRCLLSVTVEELAKQAGGEIISGADEAAELVENFMLGAMNVGSGLDYFGLKANKAAIIGSERSDIQLAALETETRCLVLCGKAEPLPAVLERAKLKKVPIIRVQDDTTTAVAKIEAVLGKTKFNEEKKLPHLARFLEQHFDLKVLDEELASSG